MSQVEALARCTWRTLLVYLRPQEGLSYDTSLHDEQFLSNSSRLFLMYGSGGVETLGYVSSEKKKGFKMPCRLIEL